MSTDVSVHPVADTWVAAVHESKDDYRPIGTALVIDKNRLLTCAHVALKDGAPRSPLWVSFPKVDGCPRRLVASVLAQYTPPITDVALLILHENVPTGTEIAPLRNPDPTALVGNSWWAFGFPDGDMIGDSANGRVGAALALGWVRLDTESRYLIRPGFSGGGLWSPDYKAVVGVVGQAHGNGDGRAITLHEASRCFPDQRLGVLAHWSPQAAGEVALQQWGWRLARDPEGTRHWQPRARGVSTDSEPGYRFRGRRAALLQLVRWLDRPNPDRQVLVITGSPGVGKSAVLGRIVTTADATARAMLPPADDAVKATVGSVHCAVHAKGKTALEVAEEIARAASARLPSDLGDLAPAVRDVLGQQARGKFNVIIDALDEAASPEQARAIIDKLVLPIAKTCADLGAQVVVGTRRSDDGGDLLDRFADVAAILDLDDAQYFEMEDLADYALASLQLVGDQREGNPYADQRRALPLADRIAAMSGRNFLVAGLIARAHGLHDDEPAVPEELSFTATVEMALFAYIQRISSVGDLSATSLLTAVAFAESPGLPAELWALVVEAMTGKQIAPEDLMAFARSSAANFLVESGTHAGAIGQGRGPATVYRLFHQALNDTLLRARSAEVSRAADERVLALALTGYGRQNGWIDVPDYLLRSLPGHASIGGVVDDLLCDDSYLLHADLRRLLEVADKATSAQGQQRAQLLRLTPQASISGPPERAALFSITEVLDDLGSTYREGTGRGPYHALWASVQPRREQHAVLEDHQGTVTGVCALSVGNRRLLASASGDGIIRIWDPQTGELRSTLEGHKGPVNAVCPVTIDGQQFIASGSRDHTVRIWIPQTGAQRAPLKCERSHVKALCTVTVNDQQVLASAGSDRKIRIWDPATGTEQLCISKPHGGWPIEVSSLCAVLLDGQEYLASGGADEAVRIWDPRTGQPRAKLEGHRPGGRDSREVGDSYAGGVLALCAVTEGDRQLLASAGSDHTVRIWDPASGTQLAVLEGHQAQVNDVCAVTIDDRQFLASAGADHHVRIWDPRTQDQEAGLATQEDRVNGVCAVRADGRQLLASAGEDSRVRIWHPRTGSRLAVLEGHRDRVNDICVITLDDRQFLASAGADAQVRIWDPRTHELRATLSGHRKSTGGNGVSAVCALTADRRDLLAGAGDDRRVRIWNPESGAVQLITKKYGEWLTGDNGICAVTVGDHQLLAAAGEDGKVRVFDPRTGAKQRTIPNPTSGLIQVSGLCAVTVADRNLLACAYSDSSVRAWDPETGEQRRVLLGHRRQVNGVGLVTVGDRQLLASASSDCTVRIWDLETESCLVTMPTHYRALAVAQVAGVLVVAMSAGLLAIELGDVS